MGCGPSSSPPSNLEDVGKAETDPSSSVKGSVKTNGSTKGSIGSGNGGKSTGSNSGKMDSTSKPSPTNSSKQAIFGNSSSSKKGPLSQKSLNNRLEVPSDVQRFEISEDLTIDFAWASQRGYYPDSPNKDNQDAYSIYPKFNNSSSNAFFGVYDGHGKTGHNCAWYVRDHLPINLAKRLSNATNKSTASMKQILTSAHIETNEGLHQSREVDDSLSGTTSISVLFEGNTIYVSNVGDSRAIIATRQPGKTSRTSFALSSDQTPYRKDERERVKKYGARIASIDQIDGIEPMHENWGNLVLGEEIDEGGDPPRIWSPKGDYPGTAFTRSLGDSVAEEVGVTAEPEIYDRKLNKNDEIIIIASDGVFEFLTNQMVVDMFELESDNKNLLDICKSIVSRAYDMWLQYETRTDDITIIALVLNHSQTSDASSAIESRSDELDCGVRVDGIKPIRRQISRNRSIVMELDNLSKSETTIDTSNLKSYFVSKDPNEKISILNALKTNFLFEHLSSEQLLAVIDLMKPKLVKKGEWVIRQGDPGTSLFVAHSGRYEVRAIPAGQEPDELTKSTGGDLVYIYQCTRVSNPLFGELSLLYGKPRMASVIAIENGKVWSLERQYYIQLVMRSYDSRKNIIKSLLSVKLLQCLEFHQIQRLADVFREESFDVDENIITQGEKADKFYIIVSGECDVMITSPDGVTKLQTCLTNNDYFGEIALLNSSPRTATVIARTATRVLSLDKNNFDKLLGPLASMIEESGKRKQETSKPSVESSTLRSLNEIEVLGVVSEENTMVLTLGTFGTSAQLKHVSVQSFIFSEVSKIQQINSLVNMVKSMEIVTANIKSPFIPNLLSIIRDSNAIHLVTRSQIVGGLNDIIRYYSESSLTSPSSAAEGGGTAQGPRLRRSFTSVVGMVDAPPRPSKLTQSDILYILACVASGLNQLHQIGIVYRAVNPGCLLLDANGLVLLGDFRTSKIGVVGGKSYTICGDIYYLAPEQINQTGHGSAVDMWALGVLAYELCSGSSPFAEAGASEVAIYSKISSFGVSKSGKNTSLNSLTYSTEMQTSYSEVVSLIHKLVLVDSKQRLSVTKPADFDKFKQVDEFKSLNWSSIGSSNAASPLLSIANFEHSEVLKNPLDQSISDKFKLAFNGENNWEKEL